MPGELLESEIVVKDEAEASQLYNRGYYGTPLSRGGLVLDLIEGTYLQETGRLEIRKRGRSVDVGQLMKLGGALRPGFEIEYLVYRDLRQRGYVVKPNVKPINFRVFPRGGGPKKTPTKYWVAAISERAVFDLEELFRLLSDASSVRKQLLLAVVDEESDLTYYRLARVEPRGAAVDKEIEAKAKALFLEDRGMVLDEEEAKRLFEAGYYGRMIGKRLQLSLMETAYLLAHGIIEVRNARTGRRMTLEGLLRQATRMQPDFPLRLRVYQDLKEKGIVVKTGFKYGSHFRGYEADPESHHAKYLIHALPSRYRGMWPEVSRAVRLAHGVKKDILLGKVGEKVEYMRFRRVRP